MEIETFDHSGYESVLNGISVGIPNRAFFSKIKISGHRHVSTDNLRASCFDLLEFGIRFRNTANTGPTRKRRPTGWPRVRWLSRYRRATSTSTGAGKRIHNVKRPSGLGLETGASVIREQLFTGRSFLPAGVWISCICCCWSSRSPSG